MLHCRTRGLAVVFVAMVSIVGVAQSHQPPQARQIRANGVDLSYVEQGQGTPVVFAHGAVGDLRFWEMQRHAFAKEYRFIAYTYRYHGTAKASHPMSYDNPTDFNRAVLDFLAQTMESADAHVRPAQP